MTVYHCYKEVSLQIVGTSVFKLDVSRREIQSLKIFLGFMMCVQEQPMILTKNILMCLLSLFYS